MTRFADQEKCEMALERQVRSLDSMGQSHSLLLLAKCFNNRRPIEKFQLNEQNEERKKIITFYGFIHWR